jgi:hypothetical protein
MLLHIRARDSGLGQQEITSSSQLFTITVTERKPLFAMRFQEYEPNGNIKELRWKVTSRSPKYYELSYDPLNRLTAADYGHFEVPALSTPAPLKVPTQHYSVPSIGYDAVGNITGITRMGRKPTTKGILRRAPRALTFACRSRQHAYSDAGLQFCGNSSCSLLTLWPWIRLSTSASHFSGSMPWCLQAAKKV